MMPELDQHLRVWSSNLDIRPYPHEMAVQIGALRPAAISAAAAILVGLSPVLNDGYFDIDRQAARLADCWSAGEPVAYLRALAGATSDAAGTIDRVRNALLPAVGVFERAGSVVAQAIVAANAATDWRLPTGIGTPEAALRDATCRTLRSTLEQQLAMVESALAEVDQVLRFDPRAGVDGLPTTGGYTPPVAPTAVSTLSEQNLDRLTADLSAADPARRAFATGVLAGLQSAAAGGGSAQLLIYDPDAFDGQGRASVVVGDLAAADHVAVLTPGIANSPVRMGGTATLARQLIEQADQLAPGESTAVVLWFGYDIPLSGEQSLLYQPDQLAGDAYAAVSADTARTGGEQLAGDLEWIARLAAPDATLTAVGHSMGSVTTSEAARFPLPVDNIVLLGSPGAGYDADSAADYPSVTPENVYVMSHPLDPITRPRTDFGAQLATALVDGPTTDPFGPDPADNAFGAQVLDAPSGVPPTLSDTNGWTVPLVIGDLDPRQHAIDNYLTGAAGLAVAGVITGRTAPVKRKSGR